MPDSLIGYVPMMMGGMFLLFRDFTAWKQRLVSSLPRPAQLSTHQLHPRPVPPTLPMPRTASTKFGWCKSGVVVPQPGATWANTAASIGTTALVVMWGISQRPASILVTLNQRKPKVHH